MASPSAPNSPLYPLDNSHAAVAAVVTSVVRAELAAFVRDLVPALRDNFSGQLESHRKVLTTVNELCDEQAARLELFIKLSRKARSILADLTEEHEQERGEDEAEDAVPNVDNMFGDLMSAMGGATSKDKDKLSSLLNKLESMNED